MSGNPGDTPNTKDVARDVDRPEDDTQAVSISLSEGPSEGNDEKDRRIPEVLPILPVRDTVAFPGTVMPLGVNREKSKRVLDEALAGSKLVAVIAQRSPETEDPGIDDLYRVGTACAVLKLLRMEDGGETVIVHGLRRIGVEKLTRTEDYLEARIHTRDDPDDEPTTEQKAFMHAIRSAATRIIELSPNIPDDARGVLRSIQAPGALADFLAANMPLGVLQKQEILETFDITERLRKTNVAVAQQLQLVELSSKIQTDVQSQVDQTQREYYLRQQLEAIREELGETTHVDKLGELREKIAKAKLPKSAEAEALRELDRIERIPSASPEYSMALDYIDWLADLPWSKNTKDQLDIERARKILDEDHYGLDQVKRRIVEFLAVRSLKTDSRGPILCFTGPPGVGKTSLGQSIARAMGRSFIRISLGGIRDEAAIRGHRRTYIGSMPGRILREIRRAGSNNPLMMLDEVDKIGQDFRGDPMSALLEVLDPAQNATFTDHYLCIPFDLSRTFFIGTANYMSAIEPALRDRMEIIEIDGYTRPEKLMIAKRHLLPRQIEANGLKPEQIELPDAIIRMIVGDYTREAGVRGLERALASVCRAQATRVASKEKTVVRVSESFVRDALGPRKFESEIAAAEALPGVVTGLAFTAVGGEILFIEASVMPGNGQLMLTGQLGDVMRESAHAARSIIRSRAKMWQIPPRAIASQDVHVHVPAGAIPKDGPSAGVAMLAAMVSSLSGQTVDPQTGMTGEITLSGRVLPIGGIREKLLAAHRAGLKRVLLPARNEADVSEVPKEVRKSLDIVFVSTIEDVILELFRTKKSKGKGERVVKKKRAKTTKKTTKSSKQKKGKSKKSKPKKSKKRKAAKKEGRTGGKASSRGRSR